MEGSRGLGLGLGWRMGISRHYSGKVWITW